MKKPWVIKAGGELLIKGPVRTKILSALAQLSRRQKIVFVHGGGPQIELALKAHRIPHKFVGGRRVTTPAAMVVVEQVLSGLINKGLAAELNSKGARAVGLSCRDGKMVTAAPIKGLGRAAKPISINASLLKTLINDAYLPVVSSVGTDRQGQAVNINADDVASALAIQLRASHLVFLTNISGVLDQKKKRISVLKTSAIDSLIKKGVITGGMIPKVQSARAAIRKGVGEVDIMNGKTGIKLNNGTRIL